MTKLLDQAVKAARNLALAQQDEIARMMLSYSELPVAESTPDEAAALTHSEEAAARGEFATDEQVQAIWAKHAL